MCSSGTDTTSGSTRGQILLILCITTVITPILKKKLKNHKITKRAGRGFFKFLEVKNKVLLELIAGEQFGGSILI